MIGQDRRSGDGWRGTLSKAFLVAAVAAFSTLATWWTAYLWAQTRMIPSEKDTAQWQKHVVTEYPDLRQRVALVEAHQTETDKRYDEILKQLAEIRRLMLLQGRR
jgi:hypothetical protein